MITGSPFLGRMLRSLADNLRSELLEELVVMKPLDEDEKRYHELADKHTEGTLGDDEKAELKSIVSANTPLSLLRKEAREALKCRG